MGMDSVTNTAGLPRKTKPKGRHPDKALSAAFVRTAPSGRHADGNGLYLFVQPSGTRSWIQRLVIRGRKRELGLGSVALVSLAEAREKALANRKLAREGGDPLAEKRRRQGVPSFAEATARVVEQKQAGWRRRAHGREWILTFERYAFPRIGKMPVSEVTSADVLEILAPIWHTKADTARRLRQRIRAPVPPEPERAHERAPQLRPGQPRHIALDLQLGLAGLVARGRHRQLLGLRRLPLAPLLWLAHPRPPPGRPLPSDRLQPVVVYQVPVAEPLVLHPGH